MRNAIILAMAGTLAACSGGGADAPGNGGAPAGGAGTDSAAWNAEDACALLPKEVVADAAGLAVSGATLSRVTPATDASAGFSQCTYSFAGGATLDFFARKSPIADNTADAIANTRKSVTEMMGATAIDVPDLGRIAFRADKMNQLHVFIGDNRYIYFMSMNPPLARPVADVEVALARKLGG